MADDRGVANERTALAWQRSALSLMAAAAIMARLTYGLLGWYSVLVLSAAALLSLWVFTASRARYSQHAGLRLGAGPRDGRAPTFLCLATVLISGIELAALVVAW